MVGEHNLGMASIFDGLNMHGVSVESADLNDLMEVIQNDELTRSNAPDQAAPTEPRQPSPFPLRIDPPTPTNETNQDSPMPVSG